MDEDITADGRWLTVGEACVKAGVSRRTIYNWKASGHLTIRLTPTGRMRILAGSLFRVDPASPATLK